MEVNAKLVQAVKKGLSASAYTVAIWTNFRWSCPNPAFQASHDTMVSQSGELRWSKATLLLARSAPWGTGAEGGEAAALAAAKGRHLAVINYSQNIQPQYFLHLRSQNSSVKCWSASFYGHRKETKKGIQGQHLKLLQKTEHRIGELVWKVAVYEILRGSAPSSYYGSLVPKQYQGLLLPEKIMSGKARVSKCKI